MVKQNLIVLGDSFCASAIHWPQQLADLLGLNLICFTEGGGQPWWVTRNWLKNVHPAHLAQTTHLVFCHTNAERIPTDNQELGLIDHTQTPKTEIEQAVNLYYRHIFDQNYTHWAQRAWFKEISADYSNFKLVHLHCFPWSLEHCQLLTGINITTNLAAISLNELGAREFGFFNDPRPNHLNEHNNQALAGELARIIQSGSAGDQALDITQFEQKTDRWFNWH